MSVPQVASSGCPVDAAALARLPFDTGGNGAASTGALPGGEARTSAANSVAPAPFPVHQGERRIAELEQAEREVLVLREERNRLERELTLALNDLTTLRTVVADFEAELVAYLDRYHPKDGRGHRWANGYGSTESVHWLRRLAGEERA